MPTKHIERRAAAAVFVVVPMMLLFAGCSLIVSSERDEDPNTCGNGFCDEDEYPTNCPEDCEAVGCGNNVCDPPLENAGTCPDDCEDIPLCGNGGCEPEETEESCPHDCAPFQCGNGMCDPGENLSNCPQDCALCGNNVIDGNEFCDGQDLGFESCMSMGLGGGFLSCTDSCQYNTEECGMGLADGDPCAEDVNCAGGICITGWNGGLSVPYGYCSGDCTGEEWCLGGGACVSDGPANPDFSLVSMCYHSCDPVSPNCRGDGGYSCDPWGTPAIDICWL